MNSRLAQGIPDTAVLSDVLAYLNQREFPRLQTGNRPEETLYARHGHIRANYRSMALHSLFQPVFDCKRRRITGHEALITGSSVSSAASVGKVLSPQRVFTLAANRDITFIDRLARTLHALNYLLQGSSGLLHLNVHPHHLLAVSADHGRVFEGILRQCGLDTRQIVLEIPAYAVPEQRRLADAVQAWQQKGYRIAIDNFGREEAHISRVRKLKPAYLKLDRTFIHAAVADKRQRQLLEKTVRMSADAGITVIATGIETHAHLDLLHTTGVHIGQGFLFGRPQPYCVAS